MKTIKIKIAAEEIRTMNRRANREAEISLGLNVNRHRVFKNKTVYSRTEKFKQNFV